MLRYQNISLCQINVKAGQQEYYLPKNANWRDKTIKKIVVYSPLVGENPVTSPVNGAQVLDSNEITNLYFDLYNEDGVNVMHNVQAYQLTAHNNHVFDIDTKLSFDLSRVYFTTAPSADGALMLYVYYNTTDTYVDEPTENITVNFPLLAGEKISLQAIVEKYMYARNKNVRYISMWNGRTAAVNYNTGFITLRDTNGYLAHENIPLFFLRPCYNPANPSAYLLPENRLRLDVDIDFNNSFIVNTQAVADNYILTFFY